MLANIIQLLSKRSVNVNSKNNGNFGKIWIRDSIYMNKKNMKQGLREYM